MQELEETLDQIYRCLTAGEIESVFHILNDESVRGNLSLGEFGREVGKIVRLVYNEFFIIATHSLLENAPKSLPQELNEGISGVLKPILDLSKKYNQKVDEVHQERLARELREKTRAKNLNESADCAIQIIKRAKTPEDTTRLAGFVGALLGTLVNDQKNAQSVVAILEKRLSKLDFSPTLINVVEKERKLRFETIAKSHIENQELDWTRILTANVVEIKSNLPDKLFLGEPTEGQMDKFRDIVCAILRVPFLKGNEEKWIDVLIILVDFCPREMGGLAEMARAEPRIYNTLGLTARRVVNRTFDSLGRLKIIQDLFLKLAEKYQDSHYFEKIVEMLGAFRSPSFHPLLKKLITQKKYAPIRGTIIDAIGQVSGVDSRIHLLDLLADDCQGLIDPPRIREATKILIALGKVVKHPLLSSEDRNILIKRVTQIIPRQERRLAIITAVQLFSYKTEEIEDSLIAWAGTVLTDSMWLMDDKPLFARGEERPASILGFREGIANTLILLGERALPHVLKIAEQNSSRYSGAFLAVGEVLVKIGNETAIPLIEKLLLTSFLTEESTIIKYQKEFYWDPTDETNKPLTKDKIISTLVYAIQKIGGDKAEELLQRLYNQIQSGGLPSIGKETANILVNASLKYAKKIRDLKNGSALPTNILDGQSSTLSSENKVLLEESIENLNSSYFLAGKDKKRRKKIEALKILGDFKNIDTIPIIIKQIEEKDPLIRSAAVSTLLSFSDPGTPPEIFKNFIKKTFELMKNFPLEVKVEMRKILIKMNPTRKAFAEALRELKSQGIARDCASEIDRLLFIAEESEFQSSQLASGEDKQDSSISQKSGVKKIPESISEIEKKRTYIQARREWIEGGKKGPPPEMPR